MDVTDWVDARLDEHGLRRSGDLEPFRERTWASIFTVPTASGRFWLKVMPAAVRHEAGLYEVLERRTPRSILTPLGIDTDRGWLLLPDAGPSLYTRQAEDELPQALHAYATVQLALAPHVDDLLATGTDDMRPERMPERFDEAMDFANGYARRQREDIGAVAALRPQYRDWCAQLVAAGRPASIDHNDLHVENVVGSSTDPRFYDWGDAVVAHPFASLLTPFDTTPAGKHDELCTSYLSAYGDPAELRAEAELALRVAIVARALVWVRVLGDRPYQHEHAHAPVAHLRRLLET